MEKERAEELSANYRKYGYLLRLKLMFWGGSLPVYPSDMKEGLRHVKMGRLSIQVLPRTWVKKMYLQKAAVLKSLPSTLCPGVRYEGGLFRYALETMVDTVTPSLDASAAKFQEYLREIAEDYQTHTKLARMAIAKKSIDFWRIASKFHPDEDPTTPPDWWKARLMERVMRRFPVVGAFYCMGLSYYIFRTDDYYHKTPGKFQRPFPGTVRNCYYFSRLIIEKWEEVPERLLSRVNMFCKDVPTKGLYKITLDKLSRDLLWIKGLNPIPIPGYPDVNEFIAKINEYMAGIDHFRFYRNGEYRLEFAQEIMAFVKFLKGPWREARKELYEKTFGAMHEGVKRKTEEGDPQEVEDYEASTGE